MSVNYEAQLIKVKEHNYIFVVTYFQCLSWNPTLNENSSSPQSPASQLVCAGLPTGKVLLTSLSNNRIIKEFVPKHSRSCNAVAWNPVYTNQIAVGLDKVRGDYSTLVWDINQTGLFYLVHKY